MADRRKPGQSQLDYLWTTFKDYAVSGRIEDSPRDYIPTQALVDKLIKNSSIELFKVVESLPEEGEENKIYLVQSGTDYAAYAFVGSLPILIGNVGGDLELQNKVDELEGKITDLEDNTITGQNAITTTSTNGDTIIKLKLDNTGNVVLSQSNTGLKAQVPVDGINSTDTVLTLTDRKLSTTLNFAYDEASKKIKLTGVGGVIIGEIDTTDFLIDGILSGVSFNETTHILTLTFNADSGQEPIEVDLSKLVDVYDGSNIRLKNITITTPAVEPASNSTLDSAISNLISKDRELRTSIDSILQKQSLVQQATITVTNLNTLELSTNSITTYESWGPRTGQVVLIQPTDNSNTRQRTYAVIVSMFSQNIQASSTYKCLLQVATAEDIASDPTFRYVWMEVNTERGQGNNTIAKWEVLPDLCNKGLITNFQFIEGGSYSALFPNGAAFSQLKALGLDTGYIVPVTVVNLSSTTAERHGFYQDGVITISDINGVVTYQIEYQEGSSPQAQLKKQKEVNFDDFKQALLDGSQFEFTVETSLENTNTLDHITSLGYNNGHIVPVKVIDNGNKRFGYYRDELICVTDEIGFTNYGVVKQGDGTTDVFVSQSGTWGNFTIRLLEEDPETNYQVLMSSPINIESTEYRSGIPVLFDYGIPEAGEIYTGIGYCYANENGTPCLVVQTTKGILKYAVLIDHDTSSASLEQIEQESVYFNEYVLFSDIQDAAWLPTLDLKPGHIYNVVGNYENRNSYGQLIVTSTDEDPSQLDNPISRAYVLLGSFYIYTEADDAGEGATTTLTRDYNNSFNICVAKYDGSSGEYMWKDNFNSLLNSKLELPILYYGDDITEEQKNHNKVTAQTLGRTLVELRLSDESRFNIAQYNARLDSLFYIDVNPRDATKPASLITFDIGLLIRDGILSNGPEFSLASYELINYMQEILTPVVPVSLNLSPGESGKEQNQNSIMQLRRRSQSTIVELYQVTTSSGSGVGMGSSRVGILGMYYPQIKQIQWIDPSTKEVKIIDVASLTGDETEIPVSSIPLKDFVGLTNVNNTSDLDKPISTATQAALDTKADKADLDKVEDTVNQLATIGSVEYVDLGLPSGLLWATCNLGASTPEELGDQIYRFTSSDDFDTDGNVKLEKDPAHLAYGGDWRMPSEDDYAELYSHCSVYAVTENSKSFMQAVSKVNGNTLKIPIGNLINSSGSYYYNMNTILRDKINATVQCKYVRLDFVPPRTYSLAFPPYTGYGAFIRPVTTNPINPNKLTTISKIDSYTVNGKKIINNPTLSKSDIGLASVDNTSDLNKPISTATQTALDKKADKTKTVLLSDIKDASTLPLLDASRYDVIDNNQVIATLDVYRGTRDDQEVASYVIKGSVIIGYALDPEQLNDRSLYYNVDSYGIYSAFGYVEDSQLKYALWTECTVSQNIDPDNIPETTEYQKGVIKQLKYWPGGAYNTQCGSTDEIVYGYIAHGVLEGDEEGKETTLIHTDLAVCDPEDIENAELYLDENNHSLVTARTLNTVKENVYSELNNKVNTFAFEALASGITEDLETKANISDLSNVLAEDVVDGDTLTGVDTVNRETLKKDLFIDLWNTACGTNGTYNEETGFFELNGLTDITYAEAVKIYEYGAPTLLNMSGRYLNAEIRTNLPPMSSKKSSSWITNSLTRMVENSTIEVFNIGRVMPGDIAYSDIPFKTSKSKLRKIIGQISMYYCTNIGSNASWPFFESTVEEFQISDINTNIYLGNLANVSLTSLTYLVTWRKTASPQDVVVTVHPDVYAKLTDTSNTEWNQLMQDAVAKQITFASAS